MNDAAVPPKSLKTSAAAAASADARAERLAEALRANLKRRKTADRARRAAAKETPSD